MNGSSQMILTINAVFLVEVRSRGHSKHRKVGGKGGKKTISKTSLQKGKIYRKVTSPGIRKGKFKEVAGTGTKKKKIRKKPKFEDYPVAEGPVIILDDDDRLDDGEIESFMVKPGEVSKPSRNNVIDDITKEKTIEYPVENNSAPAFGESLKVGFRARNSRSRKQRFRKKGEGTKSARGPEVDDMDTRGDGHLVTDVDNESYIEWDAGTKNDAEGDEKKLTAEEELIRAGEEVAGDLYCRNCNEPIRYRYIKHFTRTQDNNTVKVYGPFCSKLCSLEFQ